MFNFKELEPSRGSTLLDNALRLARNRIAIGEELLPGALKGGYVAVYADAGNRAIKLVPGHTGYKVSADENGKRHISASRRLLKQGFPVGDYIPVPGESNVFVLASGNTDQ